MKYLSKWSRTLTLSLMTPFLFFLFPLISNQYEAATKVNTDLTEEPTAENDIKINFYENTTWTNGLPIVPFDNLTYNRKGRRGADNIAGYNIPEEHKPKAHRPYVFKWDKPDTGTKKWWPQGVSGNSNSDLGGTKRLLMSSWYDFEGVNGGNHQGSRITIMDISDPDNIQYRHILLVQSSGDAKFNAGDKSEKRKTYYASYDQSKKYMPVVTHAGGISWYKNYIYLADTKFGIRVFDLTKIFETEGKGANGEDNKVCGYVDGKYHAFNYEYAVPQVATYNVTGSSQFACISLENINGRRKLWVAPFDSRTTEAEFEKVGNSLKKVNLITAVKTLNGTFRVPEDKSKHIYTTINGYVLNEDGTIDTNPSTVETHTYKYAKIRSEASQKIAGAKKLDINSVNGVYREGDKVWFSRNMAPFYENSLGRLVIQDGNNEAIMYRYPHTAEDLYYEKETDILWSCTESPTNHAYVYSAVDFGKTSNRVMFGVKRSSYKTK